MKSRKSKRIKNESVNGTSSVEDSAQLDADIMKCLRTSDLSVKEILELRENEKLHLMIMRAKVKSDDAEVKSRVNKSKPQNTKESPVEQPSISESDNVRKRLRSSDRLKVKSNDKEVETSTGKYKPKSPKKSQSVREREKMKKRSWRASLSAKELQQLREKQAQEKRKSRQKLRSRESGEKYRQKRSSKLQKRKSGEENGAEILVKEREREKDKIRKRLWRASLSVKEMQQVREKQALQKRKMRANLTDEQRMEMRRKDAERKRLQRERKV